MELATVAAVALAFGASGLAWGYRGQRDQEREQIVYLRAQLKEARAPSETAAGKGTALTTVGGGRQ